MKTLFISPLIQTTDRAATARLYSRLRRVKNQLRRSGKHSASSPVTKLTIDLNAEKPF